MPASDPARQVHVWDQEGAFYGQEAPDEGFRRVVLHFLV